MPPYLIIITILIVIISIVLIIWVAYSLTPAYQQTISITIPFNETYRFVKTSDPTINGKSQLDYLKIKVSGNLKKNSKITIIPMDKLKMLVQENLIDLYADSILVHEPDIFDVPETKLKRNSLTKKPTLENLSILFFNKLSPILYKIGGQLVNISVYSEGIKASNLRYKSTDYSKLT